DAAHVYFSANSSADWFHFNQFSAPYVPMLLIKQAQPAPPAAPDTTSAWTQKTTMFRALMITYYVDNAVDPTSPDEPPTPRLFRRVNHFDPQALAGIVETLDLTYDLVGVVDN